MKKSKALKAIERIAVQEGVSVFDVRIEMQKAIDVAFGNRGEVSTDFWDKWRGRCPSAEEFINAASEDVLGRVFGGGNQGYK